MKLPAFLLLLFLSISHGTEITHRVFGSLTDFIPAAFGDFNSDELTDLFILRNNSHTVEILLGSYENEPFLKQANLSCHFLQSSITSVVPGDFNGDAFMDVMVTVHPHDSEEYYIHVLWGGLNTLNCSFNESKPKIKLNKEPVALDYNNDFIIDLFGESISGERYIYVFTNNTEAKPHKIPLRDYNNITLSNMSMRKYHSNAFLDLNNDSIADLLVTDDNGFEIWERSNIDGNFTFKMFVKLPVKKDNLNVGQSLFIDVESKGRINHVLPTLLKNGQSWESKIFTSIGDHEEWIDLNVNLIDPQGLHWDFFPLKPTDESTPFTKTISIRSGDYNMDGYPDLIATLSNPVSDNKAFLLENVPCKDCSKFSRTFAVKWGGFIPTPNNTFLGVFFDIFQDGILDVILVEKRDSGFTTVALKNNLEYDANFVKVMVLTGLTNDKKATIIGALGNRKRTFGTNLPGPRVTCKTLDLEGNLRESVSVQMPQSAHFSLMSPYNMFGLGRTPNFVDYIQVGFASKSREWTQLIPNSQMVVIPNPINRPSRWKMQLFVTPSKVILMSGASLIVTCLVCCVIIVILHWKEKNVDRLERLQEANRFPFDAM